MKTNPLIFVVGPTGVGKSAWALDCAQTVGGVILNCDSVQAYKTLDIGTAKPTRSEQRLVPHFLFDVVEPGDVLTAGDYRRMALAVLEKEIPARPVFAVGGSGFYIQALEKGMFEIDKVEPQKETEIRSRLATMTLPQMHQELTTLDPEIAEDLNPNDSYRVQRALIIIHGHGKKLSDLKKQFRPQPLPYRQIKIGLSLERAQLRDRIHTRTMQMLANGLIQEVRQLLAKGLGDWPILQSVGYKQVLMHLRGELPESKLLDEIVLRTVQLSKRQMTWFQRDKDIRWFDLSQSKAAEKWLLSELDTRP